MRHHHKDVNFEKLQTIENFRRDEQLERLQALRLGMEVQAMSHVSIGDQVGLKITRGANQSKEKVMHEFSADELLKRRMALFQSLNDAEKRLVVMNEENNFTLKQQVRNNNGLEAHELLAAKSMDGSGLTNATSHTTDNVGRASLLNMPKGANSQVFTRSPLSDRKKRNESLASYRAKFKTFSTKLDALVAAVQRDHKASLEQRFARTQVSK